MRVDDVYLDSQGRELVVVLIKEGRVTFKYAGSMYGPTFDMNDIPLTKKEDK